jgi:hypothetical protein
VIGARRLPEAPDLLEDLRDRSSRRLRQVRQARRCDVAQRAPFPTALGYLGERGLLAAADYPRRFFNAGAPRCPKQ